LENENKGRGLTDRRPFRVLVYYCRVQGAVGYCLRRNCRYLVDHLLYQEDKYFEVSVRAGAKAPPE